MRSTRFKGVAATAVLLGLLLPATGASAIHRHRTVTGGDWASFTLDNSDSRYQSSSTVTSSNVTSLTKQWAFHTGGCDVTGTPLVKDGAVYFGDWCGNVWAVSLSLGTQLWKTTLDAPISGTLLYGDSGSGFDRLIVPIGPLGDPGTTEIVSLLPSSGNVDWTKHLSTTDTGIFDSPVEYNGQIFIGSSLGNDQTGSDRTNGCGNVWALNAGTGSVNWKVYACGVTNGVPIWSTPVIDPSTNSLFFGTGDVPLTPPPVPSIKWGYGVVSLDMTTGAENWHYNAYSSPWTGGDLDFGSTANLFTYASGGTTYQAIGIGNKDGKYYVLDRTNGTLLQKVSVADAGANLGVIGAPGVVQGSGTNPEIYIPGRCIVSSVQVGCTRAFNPSSGSVDWTTNLDGDSIGSVALIPGAVLVGDTLGNFYALDMTNGSVLKKITLPAGSVPSGIYGGITSAEGNVLVPEAFGTPSKGGVYDYAP